MLRDDAARIQVPLALLDNARAAESWIGRQRRARSVLFLDVLHPAVVVRHHQAKGDGVARLQPRELGRDFDATLWGNLRLFSRLALRRFPAALTLQAPGFGEVTAGAGGEPARLIGTPGELVLFISGRQAASRVQIEATPALADRLRTAGFRL